MIETNSLSIGGIKTVKARKIWPSEASDFTPWLAKEENISLLSKAIGIELEVDQIEASVGPYSADILAKDTGTGKYVVIENQLGKTNHDHLGKAITYGSVLDASAVIWIASDFSEEHQRALDWLNQYTSDDLAFYGVRIEVWKIDQSLPAVRFNVISRPASIKRSDAAGVPSGELSKAKLAQLAFWQAFRAKLLETKTLSSAQTARPQYWFDVPLGRSHIILSNIADTSGNRVGVRVYLGNKVVDWALPQLESQKDTIEKEIGFELEWNPNPENRDKVIAIYRNASLMDPTQRTEAVEWLVEMVKVFRKVFMPRVKKLSPLSEG